MGDDPPYPQELERDLTLRDGTRLRLRPIRPDDAPRLQELYGRLSRHTAYQRRLALVAEHDVEGVAELVGVGRYEPTDAPDTAEVAFVVQDGWQDRGLGTVLFQEILAAAAARGVRRFRAWVLADNRRMLDLIVRYGAVEQRRTEQGVTELVFTRLGGPDMAPQSS